ncbi:MAG: nucleotidyltransferase family protein [Flavobacteriaceae bacterium]|nr:nucleotidyltransferase family protein [Flavobacteriaceae bacterium]
MSKSAILILAAGSSSRMGKPKQLLPYKHTTLLGWAIEQAHASSVDEVVCVLGAKAKEIELSIQRYDVNIIHNSNYEQGLSSSIISGLKEIGDRNVVLMMLADQPNISSQYLNKLLEMHTSEPNKIIASNYGNSVGVPAVFPKKYYPELLNLKGDKGAKEILNELRSDVVTINSSEILQDIDTSLDYDRLTK